MKLGSTHSVELDLEDDRCRIAALRLGRVKRHIALSEEFDGVSPTPPTASRRSLDTSTASFRGQIIERAVAEQPLGPGTRTLTVESRLATGVFNSSVAARRVLSATLRIAFEMVAPATWRLRLGEAATVAEEAGTLRLELAADTTIRISISSGRIEVREDDSPRCPTLSVALAAGRVDVTILVDVKAWANVSNTVVVCRPHQMREAAIAVAAVPTRQFVPLIVLEPSPMPIADFMTIFRDYHAKTETSRGQLGLFSEVEFAVMSEAERRDRVKGWAGRRHLQETMQPYRSWAKRNEMLRSAILDFDIETAICLFDAGRSDMAVSEMEYALLDQPAGDYDLSAIRGLLDDIEVRTLRSCCASRADEGADLQKLDRVYAECREMFAARTEEPLDLDADDPASVILGLYEARRQGRGLRFKATGPAIGVGATRSSGETAGNHVVAVEVRADAQTLVASLYAADLGTKLIVTAAPSLDATQRLVAELQDAVTAQATRSPVPSTALDPAPADRRVPGADGEVRLAGSAIVAAYRKLVLGDPRLSLLLSLEKEVTSQTTQEFRAAVGSAALTIFGSGMPYPFVREGEATWSSKPIGHIIADADLIIMSEMHDVGAIDQIVAFNLIVDPGFFERSETEVVTEALRSRSAKTLLLGKGSQIGGLFLTAVRTLPIDFIFFNTHGSDHSIVLDFYQMENFQITQWMTLSDNSLIFNNSCQSWTGVGRDFVRIGARGYIGTLWSVGARAAAEVARRSIVRMINGREPMSGAVCQPDVDPLTSRAYIFVGSANASFSMDDEEALVDDPVRLCAVLQNYLHLLGEARPRVSSKTPDAFTARLYTESTALADALIALDDDGLQAMIADAMLGLLHILSEKHNVLNASLDRRWEMAETCERALNRAPLEGESRGRRLASLQVHKSEICRLRGDFAEADRWASASIDTEAEFGKLGIRGRQGRIQVAIDQGRLDDAYKYAEEARVIARSSAERHVMLGTLGRLCQIMKRDPSRLDQGIALAKEGLDIAIKRKDAKEESAFELDLAQFHLLKGNPSEGLLAAKRALAAARRADSQLGEIAAYGSIGQCYFHLKDATNARAHALLGLARAREFEELRRVATFLGDLAQIEEMDGNAAAACRYWGDAIEAGARVAPPTSFTSDLVGGVRSCVTRGDLEACALLICRAMTSLELMRPDFLAAADQYLFQLILELSAAWPAATRLGLFQRIFDLCKTEIRPSDAPSELRTRAELLLATVQTFILIERRQALEAQALATRIDSDRRLSGRFATQVASLLSKGT